MLDVASDTTPIASLRWLVASFSRVRMIVQITNNGPAELLLDTSTRFRMMPSRVNVSPFFIMRQANAIFGCVVITNAMLYVRCFIQSSTLVLTRMDVEIFYRIVWWRLTGLNFGISWQRDAHWFGINRRWENHGNNKDFENPASLKNDWKPWIEANWLYTNHLLKLIPAACWQSQNVSDGKP